MDCNRVLATVGRDEQSTSSSVKYIEMGSPCGFSQKVQDIHPLLNTLGVQN